MKLSKGIKNPLKPKFPKIIIDKSRPVLYAFVDGGISGNGKQVNEGGYGFVVVENDQVFYEYSRQVDNTTNNIMEMLAIYDCLQWISENGIEDQVLIHTDSQYCLHSICTWYKGYIARGWKDVKNAWLWKDILELKDRLPNVQYKWIRAHQDDPLKVKHGNSEFETKWNIYADNLATEAYRSKQQPINITEEEMQDMQSRGDKGLKVPSKQWEEWSDESPIMELSKRLIETSNELERLKGVVRAYMNLGEGYRRDELEAEIKALI